MSQAKPEGDSKLTLNTALHTKYWLRCLKTFLPTAYQEQDSSRIVLGFFILFSLDILDGINKHTTLQERRNFVNFIYRCQHPEGGFRSFPGSDFGQDRKDKDNERWDPVNIAGTYFALVSLLILDDDLSQVKRRETLAWVRNLQRKDGSFGEIAAGPQGIVDGGQDVRFCMLASLICSVLGEESSSRKNIDYIVDAETLLQFVLASQSYDGGVARKPNCESHAGSTYCAVSTLQLLKQISEPNLVNNDCPIQLPAETLRDLIHWLSHRQTTMLSDYQSVDLSEDAHEANVDVINHSLDARKSEDEVHTFTNATLALPPQLLGFEHLELTETTIVAGLNGRVNKPADTCYSFWVGASLAILGHSEFIDQPANRRYLLGKTQHRIGGFGKFPGDPPDILHSALALACLALYGEPGLKLIDPVFCVSLDVKQRLEALPWKKKF